MMAECTSTPLKGQRAKDTNKKAGEMKGGGFKSLGLPRPSKGHTSVNRMITVVFFLQGSVMIRSGGNLWIIDHQIKNTSPIFHELEFLKLHKFAFCAVDTLMTRCEGHLVNHLMSDFNKIWLRKCGNGLEIHNHGPMNSLSCPLIWSLWTWNRMNPHESIKQNANWFCYRDQWASRQKISWQTQFQYIMIK